jgi:diaminopimelate decarboxylase
MSISESNRIVRVRNASGPESTPAADDHRDGGQSDVIARCSQWHRAFPHADICYPATLLALPAAANWVYDRGCEVDARSPQGISFTLSARIAPARVILHCTGATGRTLYDALSLGVGQFIVDSQNTAAMLGACAQRPQHVLVDVTSGAPGWLFKAVLAEERLTMTGLYSELGYPEDGVLRMLEQMSDVRSRHGMTLSGIGIGIRGGHASPVEAVAERVADALEEGCARFRLPRPALTVFPDWTALTHDL